MEPTLANVSYGIDPEEVFDVYIPPGLDPNVRAPMLANFHGGGWHDGDKANLNTYLPDAQGVGMIEKAFADGMIVVSVNYPLCAESKLPDGSPNPDFPKNTFPTACLSVQKCIKFLRQNATVYGGDPERIYGIGGSAGGHLLLWAAYGADVTARPDGVVACWTPTAVTKELLASLPLRPAQWNFFGAKTKAEFDAIPSSVTQSASPYWTAQAGDVAAKLSIPVIGVYLGDPTKLKVTDWNWPVQDPHGSEWGVLLKDVENKTGVSFKDFSLMINPSYADPTPTTDAVRDWLHNRAQRPFVKFGTPAGVVPDPYGFIAKWCVNLGPRDAAAFVAAVEADNDGSQYSIDVGFWINKTPNPDNTGADLVLNWSQITSLTPAPFSVTVADNHVTIELIPLPLPLIGWNSVTIGARIKGPGFQDVISLVSYTA